MSNLPEQGRPNWGDTSCYAQILALLVPEQLICCLSWWIAAWRLLHGMEPLPDGAMHDTSRSHERIAEVQARWLQMCTTRCRFQPKRPTQLLQAMPGEMQR